MKNIALFLITALALGATSLLAEPSPAAKAIEAILDTPVPAYSSSGRPGRTVLEGIGQAYNLPIMVEPEVAGDVTFAIYGAKLRNVLDAICEPNGWHYEINDGGYITVSRFVTRTYSVDYLQATQTETSSESVSLDGGNQNSGSNGYPNGSTGSTNTATGTNGQSGSSSGSTSSSSLSVSSNSQSDFWGHFESDVKGMLGDKETVIVNRFAGIVQLRASLKTQAAMESYIQHVMGRVRRKAQITVRVVRVDLNNQSQLGIDWNVAQFYASGQHERNSPIIGGTFNPVNGGTPTSGLGTSLGGITSIGSTALAGTTFTGVISAGKVAAMISALQQQGNVTVEERTEASALNNRMAFIQVSVDQPLFTRQNSTTFNPGATASSINGVPITQTNYSEQNVSFGNVLEVTPQIDDNLVTTLSVAPSITDLKGTVTSPDGQSTAFISGVKRMRTTVTLRNGETAVIGGFHQVTKGTQNNSVPILSDIPWLGRAFQNKASIETTSEIVLLITVNTQQPDLSPVEEVATPSAEKSSPFVAQTADRRVELIGVGSPQPQ